jgi:hypothetical protein
MRTKPHIARLRGRWFCGIVGPNARTAAYTPKRSWELWCFYRHHQPELAQ